MSVVACVEHTVCLDDNGHVYVYGDNFNSRCGFRNEEREITIPQQLEIPVSIVCIAGGRYHSACVDCTGHLWVFGDARFDTLGIKCKSNDGIGPTMVDGLEDLVSVTWVYAYCLFEFVWRSLFLW